MKTKGSTRALLILFGALSVALLVTLVLQVNSLDRRLITQAQQIRAVGESTERVAGELRRLSSGAVTSGGATVGTSAGCEIDQVLHPEVQNFLVPQDQHWPPAGARMDGRLNKGWPSGDPKGFNPLLENAADLSEDIANYVDYPLAERNKWTNPDTWFGGMACRVEITDDYKEYTIYLRKGVFWQTPAAVDVKSERYKWLAGPHEVTAEDLVFTLDMLMHPQVENGFAKNYYEELESWKAVGSHTLVVRWKKKLFHSLGATLGLTPIPKFLFGYDEQGKPFPKETIGLRFNQHWYNNKGYVGAGPYRLTEYAPGRRLLLERDQDFAGEQPAIQRISHAIYTDPNLTLLKWKAGEIDVSGPNRSLTPSQYREEILQYQNMPKVAWPKDSPFLDGRINCQVVDAMVYRYIGWNSDRPMFSDARVRTAMTLALNRKLITERVFVGLGEVALGPFLPRSGGIDTSVDPLDFNLERSKKLLTEAGWADTDGDGLLDKVLNGKKTPLEFSLLIYASRPEYAALANIFKEDLIKLGVKLNVSSAEWSLMQKRMDEKTFDAFTGGWGLGWDEDPYQIWHSSQADIPKGSNRVGFRNKEADRLIEELRQTFDPQERKQMLQKIHRIIWEAQPYTFILTEKSVVCIRNNVKNAIIAKVRPMSDYRPWSVAAGP